MTRRILCLLLTCLLLANLPAAWAAEDEDTITITLHYNEDDCTVRVYDGNRQGDPESGLFVTGDGQSVRIPKGSWTVYEIYDIRDGLRIGHVTLNGVDQTKGFVNGAYGSLAISNVGRDYVLTAEMEPVPETLPIISKVTIFTDSSGTDLAPENMSFVDDTSVRLNGVAEFSDGVKYPTYYGSGQWQYSTDGVTWHDTRAWGSNRYDFWPGWPNHANANEIDYLNDSYDIRLAAKPRRLYAAGGEMYSNVIHVNGGAGAAAPLSLKSVTANTAAAEIGDTVTWTANAAGGSAVRYCFYVFKDGKVIERGVYGAANTCRYTVSAPGTYTVRVYAKDGSAAALQLTGGSVTVAAAEPLVLKGVTADKSSAAPGETITWTVSAEGGTSVKYCFYIFKNGKILERGAYGAAGTCSYMAADPGTYTVRVYAKDGSAAALQANSGNTVVSSPLELKGVTADKSSAAPGETITWTVSAEGGTSVKYCFYIFKNGKILERGAYGTGKTFRYTVSTAGTYTVRVYGKDGSAAALQLTGGSVTVR